MASEARRRNSACAIAVFDRAKLLTSVEGAGSRVRIKGTGKRGAGGRFLGGDAEIVQNRGGRKQVGGLIYGAFPSAPGQPPHKQTGRLNSSIAWELIGDLVARIGSNVKHSRWLELGTRFMAARPWLRRSLRELIPYCQAVWRRPWRFTA